MKLVDLDPRWIGENGTPYQRPDGVWLADRRIVGITFQCPIHPGGGCYQGVFFANPADGGPPTETPQKCLWRRTGDTFDTLTLTPSIHVKDGEDGPTHWHGFITGGNVI